MSFLRRFRPSVYSLETQAENSWCQHVLGRVRELQLLEYELDLCKVRLDLDLYLFSVLPNHRVELIFSRILGTLSRDTAERSVPTEYLDPESRPNVRVLFLSLFYKTRFEGLELTCSSSSPCSAHVLQSLHSIITSSHTQTPVVTEPCLSNLRVKLFSNSSLSIEESYHLKQFIRTLSNLQNLTLWYAADDSLLHILEETCPRILSLDLWKSSQVTDTGLLCFLGYQHTSEDCYKNKSQVFGEHKTNDRFIQKQNKINCCNLRRVLLKETSVSSAGLFSLIENCSELEYLEYSKGILEDELLQLLSENYARKKAVYSLRSIFINVNSMPALFNIVKSLPCLTKLSIWSSLKAPPGSWLQSDFQFLSSLQLGGIQNSFFLKQLLNLVGNKLISLELNSLHFPVNICEIGAVCLNLQELRLFSLKVFCTTKKKHIDENQTENNSVDKPLNIQNTIRTIKNLETFKSLVKEETNFATILQKSLNCEELVRANPSLNKEQQSCDEDSLKTVNFDKIRSLQFFLLEHQGEENVLEYILSRATSLQNIQVTGKDSLNHDILHNILKLNPLKKLRRFVLSVPTHENSPLELSTESLNLLQQSCPQLQCIGDLRHWKVSRSEKVKFSLQHHLV